MSRKIACPNCEVELPGLTNFCPNCGSSLQIVTRNPSRITPARFFILVVASLGLFIFGWLAQSTLSGKKPEKMFSASAMNAENRGSDSGAGPAHAVDSNIDYDDPELVKIREHAKNKPLDLELQKSLSSLLLQKIRSINPTPQALIFETIDVLRNVLNLNPSDPDALIAMADISFDQQAFGKATEFYQKYLAIQKDDLNARARYASSLTFSGKHKEALAELEQVMNKDPKNFHAKAYTAITYAQMGDVVKAKAYGKEALNLAPSDEAKERFSQFLKQLDESPKQEAARNNINGNNVTGKNVTDSPVITYIKTNQIAGPKYRSHELTSNNELVINFENFPMQAMPSFAKDKFFSSLKEAATKESVKPDKIIFRDLSNPSKDLEVLSLK